MERLQSDVAARLASVEFFADIPVLVARPRKNLSAAVIFQKLEAALNVFTAKGGKAGAAVLVKMPLAELPDPDSDGPVFEPSISISCHENPLINLGDSGTGKSVEDIALTVISSLHGLSLANGMQQLYAPRECYTPVGDGDMPGQWVIEVKLATRFKFARGAQLTAPTIAGTPAAVSLSGAAGASLYYTSDGSYPSAQNADASLYAGPFAVGSGSLVRAGAYMTGRRPSDIAGATIK